MGVRQRYDEGRDGGLRVGLVDLDDQQSVVHGDVDLVLVHTRALGEAGQCNRKRA